jgi:hypothetical protein
MLMLMLMLILRCQRGQDERESRCRSRERESSWNKSEQHLAVFFFLFLLVVGCFLGVAAFVRQGAYLCREVAGHPFASGFSFLMLYIDIHSYSQKRLTIIQHMLA